MSQKESMVLVAAAYENVADALSALDAIEQLHNDQMIGSYDAALIDKENGKPHIAKADGSPARPRHPLSS